MYFIPRNNAVYNYIAHTNVKRRYCATLFFVVLFGLVGFYGVYMPLAAHIKLSKIELARLKKQYEETEHIKKSNKEISLLTEASKKNIAASIIADDKQQEHCSKRIQYVFDTVAQLGLVLNSYGSCKEKNKEWYIKDSAHVQVTGSLEKLLSFLKTIKDSDQMIMLSHLAITRVKDDAFQLSCDVGIITVKN